MIGTLDDQYWMRRALAEARRGQGFVEPNPMVGAVVVRDGRVLGIGHHAVFGGPHAEVEALADAGVVDGAGVGAKGSTMYVTLEPCCHVGKTPPCTDAILRAGISRVVSAMRDPFPKVAGGGFLKLQSAGLQVEIGLEEAASRRLNAPYLKRLQSDMPFVIAKWAMTLDGKTACRSGDSRWISGERSRSLVHELRGRVDGILVGIGTALADDPELTARPPGARQAVRIVIDPAARLPLESRLVKTALEVPVWVAHNDRASADRRKMLKALGCELLSFPGDDRVPIVPLLKELGRRGFSNVLVEGGGITLGRFFDAGQVDAVEVYIAPILEGGSHLFQPLRGLGVGRMTEALRLDHHEVQILDDDVLIRGTVSRIMVD